MAYITLTTRGLPEYGHSAAALRGIHTLTHGEYSPDLDNTRWRADRSAQYACSRWLRDCNSECVVRSGDIEGWALVSEPGEAPPREVQSARSLIRAVVDLGRRHAG